MKNTTDFPIFDAHTHIYPDNLAEKASVALGHFYSLTIDGKGTASDLIQNCKEAGVKGFLMLGVATVGEQVTNVNRYLKTCIGYARDQGMEAYAFGSFHQDVDPDTVVDQISEFGLSGVKIHPDIQRVSIDDPRILRLCEKIEGRMPINFHMGDPREEFTYSRPEKLVEVLKRFPKLTVIASHLGGYSCWDKVADWYAPYENVLFDTSSAVEYLPSDQAVKLIRTLGVHRTFFGTDYPIRTQKEGMAVFNRLELSDEEKMAILWVNIHRLLVAKEHP
ncbi:MAG: amidohydrolase family protein [Eubacteriales bacterium]